MTLNDMAFARTDVKSLRDEIQKLIKAIEKESSDTGTPVTR